MDFTFGVSPAPATSSGGTVTSISSDSANIVVTNPTTTPVLSPSATPTYTTVTSGAFISSTANPASVGAIRLANANGIYFRNAAAGADYVGLYTSSTNEVTVGATASTVTTGTSSVGINAYNQTLTCKSAVSYFDVTQLNVRHQTGTTIVVIDPNGFTCNSAGSPGFVMATSCVFSWNSVATAAFVGKPFIFTGQPSTGTGATVGGAWSATGGAAANGSGTGGAVTLAGGAGVTGGACTVGPGVGSGGTNGVLNLQNLVTTTSAPSAGGGTALPATPAGYATISVNGTPRQIAYY